MGKKKNQEEEEEEEEEEQYHVEVITKAQVNSDYDWEYLVKWAGYPSDDDSWEPAQNVATCERLLKSFWDHIGLDEQDYARGTVFSAKDWWIEKEKRFFAKTFAKETGSKDKSKGSNKGKGSSSKPASSASVSTLTQQRKRPRPKTISDASEDDAPLLSSKRKKKKPKKAVLSISSSDSEQARRSHSRSGEQKTKPKDVAQSTPEANTKHSEDTPLSPVPDTDADSLFSGPEQPSSPNIALSQFPASATDQPGASTSAMNTSTGGPSTTKTVRTLPAHKERQANPKVKMMDFSEVGMSSANAIPTKQRIAQGGSGSSVAKSTTLPPLVIPPKKSLAGMSFKKKQSMTKPASPAVPSASSTTISAMTDNTATAIQSRFADNQDVVQSPASMFSNEGWGSPAQNSPDIGSPSSSRMPPPQTQPTRDPRRPSLPLPRRAAAPRPPDPIAQADKFLASVMPESLAAPMHESTGEDDQPISLPTTAKVAPKMIKPPPGRTPKKWKWEGELCIDVSKDKADRVCDIVLDEQTEPRPVGIRLSVCTASVDSLRFKKFHDLSDLYLILPACGSAQQYCKIVPKADKDKAPLGTLRGYMEKRRQFTYTHMCLDDDPMGLLFVIPTLFAPVCDLFEVPESLKADKGLVAVLVPWTLSIDEVKKLDWKLPLNELAERTTPRISLPEPLQFRNLPSRFYYALRVLKFPSELLHWMTISVHPRPYCICHAVGDGKKKNPGWDRRKQEEPGVETMLLRMVLDECPGSTDKGYNKAVKAIFVHIGSLWSISKAGAVNGRRAKEPDVRIFTYGTHESISPDRWGFKEVYPVGGVITFTPNAILEQPFKTYKLMERIDRHPLWTAFLLPSVVGTAAKLICKDHDPLTLIDQDIFPHQSLLDLIEDGKISLLTQPPLTRRPAEDPNTHKMIDPAMSWITTQLKILAATPRVMLENCLESMRRVQANNKDQDLATVVSQEVLSELWRAQFQPAMMDNYRRYVVVTGKKDTCKDSSNLLEVVHLDEFDFKDGMFRTPL